MDYLKSGSKRRQCTAGYDRLKMGICTLNSVSQTQYKWLCRNPLRILPIDCVCIFM